MPFCEAIRTKKLLAFWYHGHRQLVEPHAFGMDRDHESALLAYQIAGSNDVGTVPDWRLYKSLEVRTVAIIPIEFALARVGYQRDDPRFLAIDCQL